MTITCLSFKHADKEMTEILSCNWIVEFEESIEACSFFFVIESERRHDIGMAAIGPTDGGHLIYPSPSSTVPFSHFKEECFEMELL